MLNKFSYNSTGACCRSARPFFNIKETPFILEVDFQYNPKRKKHSILLAKILFRDGRTYRPIDVVDGLEITNNKVQAVFNPEPGVYVASYRITLDDPLRSLVVQDVQIKVNT